MKTLVSSWFIVLLVCASSAAELKVATVDLQRLLREYYRAQEIAQQLKAREGALLKELEGLRLDGQRLLKETRELQELSMDTALSLAGREEKKKSFELKLADFRAFETRYENVRVQRETELQNYALQANRRVVDEVLTTIRGIGDREGFNLVLNASKAAPVTSDVLFTKNVDDISEKVLASLNATKPVSPEPARKPDAP